MRPLHLDAVQGRKSEFLKSFSPEQLLTAFELLSQREDLPPLYIHWGTQHLLSQLAPAGTAALLRLYGRRHRKLAFSTTKDVLDKLFSDDELKSILTSREALYARADVMVDTSGHDGHFFVIHR